MSIIYSDYSHVPTLHTDPGLEENDNLHRIQRSDGESEEEVGESELAVEMPLGNLESLFICSELFTDIVCQKCVHICIGQFYHCFFSVDINLGEDLNLCKLPNFLSIDTRPFDPET